MSTRHPVHRLHPLPWVLLMLLAGSAHAADKEPLLGQIVIDPAHPAWLMRAGGKHLFICGPGDPEDFLYRGTRNPDGTRDGDQEALIRKLIRHGGNCIYLQAVRSHGGDGRRDHNPFVDSDPAKGLDDDILAQWLDWFRLMDRHDILIYLFVYDDGSRVWKTGDRVGPAESAFLGRVARKFGGLKNLIWVVAEESEEAYSSARVRAIAETLRRADPHAHLVGNHHHSGTRFKAWQEGGPLTHFAMQLTRKGADAHAGGVAAFREARGRYQVIYSENTAADPPTIHFAWASALGGLQPMLLGADIATTPPRLLNQCRHLQRFFEAADFYTMAPHDELAHGGARWILADPGRSAIAYAPRLEGGMGVKGLATGRYDLLWLDCEEGTRRSVKGVTVRDGDTTFSRPDGIGRHCALWIHQAKESKGRP